MRILLCIFLLFAFISPSYAFKFKIQKKQKPQKEKMVETKQEWEVKAQNVPLGDRELEKKDEPKTDKKNYYPAPHYVFELYNYPAGKRNYDIRFIKKNLVEHPIIVSDKECRYVAYANYYYRMDIDQIYSDFYVEKLDTAKTKTQRVLDYNHRQLARNPVLLSGFKEQRKNLYNGLSLVDWSSDGKKVLIKEQIGSTIGGIYRTYMYVYNIDEDKTTKLSNFNETLVDYYLDAKNIQLARFRYDIQPLGFSANNDNMVCANLFVFDEEGNKIFLGVWGYDFEEGRTILLSSTNPSVPISANGLVLKRVLE